MKNVLLPALLVILIAITSCNKCDPSNSEGGIIIKDAIVKEINGPEGASFITDTSQVEGTLEVSFDGGLTYEPIDFSEYSAFSLPTSASCSSGYHRSVITDEVAEIVTYKIDITECDYCEGITTIDNWVITTAVPANYTVIYDINKN